MPRRLGALVILALTTAACGGDSFEGTWRLVSFEVDGQPVPTGEPFFLEIGDDGFRADTPCAGAEGEFGGDIFVPAVECESADRDAAEDRMLQAFADDPVEVDGRLLFVEGDVRLIYESFTDPIATELIDVLGDDRRSVEVASALPPAAVTGSVPPAFEALVPVPSPVPDVELFLGLLDGRPCVAAGTSSSLRVSCTGPRDLIAGSVAVYLPEPAPDAFRVAIIPDRFIDAVADAGFGPVESNLLLVDAEVPAGRQVLTSSTGDTFTLVIGEPMGGPTTVPPTTAP